MSKWYELCHSGALFPYPYKQHYIPILFNNKAIILKSAAEEYATLYAKCLLLEKVKTDKFKENFWEFWKYYVDKKISNLNGCDFSGIVGHLKKKREKRKKIDITKYKEAILNKVKQLVLNPVIEPPGIFIGRGDHPLAGCVKKRILPEDVTINIGKECKVPIPSQLTNKGIIKMSNSKWGRVISDSNVEWIASWSDNITGKKKYIWLSGGSKFKSLSDENKFNKAKKLKGLTNKIKKLMKKLLLSNNKKETQMGLAIFMISELSLRVGGEKNIVITADTVGVTSLRAEHIFLSNNNTVTIRFFGKDYILYEKTFKVPKHIFQAFRTNLLGKNPKEKLFNLLTARKLNDFLHSIMPGLSAKVFRTLNVSNTFQQKLNKINLESGKKNILAEVKEANKLVALMCNHKKGNELSLLTTKANYIDPRILFSFSEKTGIDIKHFYSKNLIKKFNWAKNVSDWSF